MEEEVKSHYIAYFDILGYSALIHENKDNVQDILFKYLHLVQDVIQKTKNTYPAYEKITLKMFSDNFLIIYGDDNRWSNDDYQSVKALSYLLALIQLHCLEKYHILIRGCITKGEIYYNKDVIFGDGLIRAVELEKRAIYPRIILDKERLEDEACGELCEKCIRFDTDEEYYVDFFDIIGWGIYNDDEFADEEKHQPYIRDAVYDLVLANGTYSEKEKTVNDIELQEKIIAKYTWLLSKYNEYCYFYADDMMLPFELKLNHKYMKYEININPELGDTYSPVYWQQ